MIKVYVYKGLFGGLFTLLTLSLHQLLFPYFFLKIRYRMSYSDADSDNESYGYDSSNYGYDEHDYGDYGYDEDYEYYEETEGFYPTDFSSFSELLTNAQKYDEYKSSIVDEMYEYFKYTPYSSASIKKYGCWGFLNHSSNFGISEEVATADFDKLVDELIARCQKEKMEREIIENEKRLNTLKYEYASFLERVSYDIKRNVYPYGRFKGVQIGCIEHIYKGGIQRFSEVRDTTISYEDEFLNCVKRGLVERLRGDCGMPPDFRNMEERCFATLFRRVNGDKSQFLEQLVPEFVEFLTKKLCIDASAESESHREMLRKVDPEITFNFELTRFVPELFNKVMATYAGGREVTYVDKLFEYIAYYVYPPPTIIVIPSAREKTEMEYRYAQSAGVSVSTLREWRDRGPSNLKEHRAVVPAYGKEYGMDRAYRIHLEREEEGLSMFY
jgi:hypothetical protein